jgi:hypothetical protein
MEKILRPGVFRRSIEIGNVAGEARVEVEDDAHHYYARIVHDGTQVTATSGLALRTPWTLCAGSVPALQRLIGMQLSPHPQGAYDFTDFASQCTHMFDAANLAIAHAARGIRYRRYDVTVPVQDFDSPRTISLHSDGTLVMSWTFADRTRIIGPARFAGRDVRNLMAWVAAEVTDLDELEAIFILRRAWLVAGVRNTNLDGFAHAGARAASASKMGACLVFQAGVAERAARIIGSTLDFTMVPDAMLSDPDRSTWFADRKAEMQA